MNNIHLSILVVNCQGGPYVELLLRSLERTLPDRSNIQIIVIDNFRFGCTAKTLPQKTTGTLRYYASLIKHWRSITETYQFTVPKDLPLTHLKTSYAPVFWSRAMNLYCRCSSLSHLKGIEMGYRAVDPQSEMVALMDQDVALLNCNWLYHFLDRFRDPDTVLVGAFQELDICRRPFLRPYCLMFRRSFYDQFDHIFDASHEGDTASRLTYLCEDHHQRWQLFRNSKNDPNLCERYEPLGMGDVAVDDYGNLLLSHQGRSRSAPNMDWIAKMEGLVATL